MNKKFFFLLVFILTTIVLLIFNSFLADQNEFVTVLSAGILAVLYVLSGFLMISWAFTKPMKMFMSVVLGGIGIRLILTAIALVLVIKVFAMNISIFLATFGVLYFLFQIVEIYFINKEINNRKLAKLNIVNDK